MASSSDVNPVFIKICTIKARSLSENLDWVSKTGLHSSFRKQGEKTG